jgi:DNA-binding NarL/FixJ family response regulator
MELTPFQQRLAVRVHAGRSNAEIAQELGVSHGTVRGQLHRLYQRVGVRSRLELALLVEQRRRRVETR